MNDTAVLLPLDTLARHLDVPEYMLRGIPPAGRAASTDEALYDPVVAKLHLRRQGVIFVNGEAVLIR